MGQQDRPPRSLDGAHQAEEEVHSTLLGVDLPLETRNWLLLSTARVIRRPELIMGDSLEAFSNFDRNTAFRRIACAVIPRVGAAASDWLLPVMLDR